MRKQLSIIIPVFNEEDTIIKILRQIQEIDTSPWEKEIIVVDDGSTDSTVSKVQKIISDLSATTLIVHDSNKGKGSAVRTGIKKAKGEYILIQDADLEYNPKDIPRLLMPIIENKAEVVYGTRLKRLPNLQRDERTFRFLLHYIGNRALSLVVSILYKHSLTDIETGYKIFPREVVKGMQLTAKGFEFEPEITIQLIKAGYTIHEVPIRTTPRGYDKGKKLKTIPDGLKALKTILSYL